MSEKTFKMVGNELVKKINKTILFINEKNNNYDDIIKTLMLNLGLSVKTARRYYSDLEFMGLIDDNGLTEEGVIYLNIYKELE